MLIKKSVELITYFMKNKCIGNSKIVNSPPILKLLKYLLEQILKADKYVRQHRLTIQFSEYPIKHMSDIPKSRIFVKGATPKKIEDYIHSHSTYYLKYQFNVFHRNICIYFIISHHPTSIEKKKYDEYVERMFMWLYILNVHSSNMCSSTLNVFLYFTQLEKLLPILHHTEDVILDETNVNTAYTYSCKKNNDIVIFRKEEWFKVFIHETFHAFGLDFSSEDNSIATKKILHLFNVNSLVNVFEAYTESWARIMNILFTSYFIVLGTENKSGPFTSFDKTQTDNFISHFNVFIYLEQLYSCFQMIKVLNYMSIQYEDLVHFQRDPKIKLKYREKSNVLSYYIITNILMFFYQDFFIWCNKNNKTIFQSDKTTKYQILFCDFIENQYKREKFLYFIQCIQQSMLSLKKSNLIIRNNLRMTICELE